MEDLGNIATAKPKHVHEGELSKHNRFRCPASFKLGDLVLVQTSP